MLASHNQQLKQRTEARNMYIILNLAEEKQIPDRKIGQFYDISNQSTEVFCVFMTLTKMCFGHS